MMIARLRSTNLATFPALRVARWLVWELVLVASKLFRRSGFPPTLLQVNVPRPMNQV